MCSIADRNDEEEHDKMHSVMYPHRAFGSAARKKAEMTQLFALTRYHFITVFSMILDHISIALFARCSSSTIYANRKIIRSVLNINRSLCSRQLLFSLNKIQLVFPLFSLLMLIN